MNKLRTSVVFACHNTEKTIARCLDSIISNAPHEIIAVNDASADSTKKILEAYSKKFPSLKTINLEKQSGFAVAENLGIEKASGDVVFLTNADCYVPHDWIPSLLKHYEDPNVMAAGGPRIDIENHKEDAATLGAGNASFRKSIIKEVGNLEKGVIAGEDTEFFMRIKHKGHGVVEDKSVVVLHDHQIPFKQILNKNFKYGIRGGQIARRYPHAKYMSRFFLIPVFWFPFKDISPMAKHIAARIFNNAGKFWGYVKG
jgi:glycosyltransferase involved in cell wall biosynthesis